MSEQRPRVLVLAGKVTDAEEVRRSLCDCFEPDMFDDVQAAMAALRSGKSYHAVFADVGDFLPLERSLVDQQASLVLNTIGEGVCVVDDKGRTLWNNERMKNFPSEVRERVRQTCASALTLFAHHATANASDTQKNQSKKFGFQAGEDAYYEAFVSPIKNDESQIKQVVAVVWDASTGRRLQQKIDAIDAAGRELVRLESESISKMTVTERLRLLEEKVIRYTTDLMHFDHFIVRLLHKKTNKLEPVISMGLPNEALDVNLYAEPEGNGISGWVAATGRSYICNDVEKDRRYVIGLGHAKSSLTVPLRLHDKVIGVFNVESKQIGAFHEEDRQFAEIFGRYIAMALTVLDLLVVERYTITGRMADNVVQEMAAPLNDIVTETQALIDQFIGDEDLRSKLEKILENVEAIRTGVRDVTQGPKTVLGSQDIKANIDPVIAGKKILVADDEANIRNTIAGVIAKLGGEVIVCKDGHEASSAIDNHTLDLVVSDIRMPHRDGYEIFAAAQRARADMPVILMTGFGYDPSHSIVRASQAGLQAVLYKPFRVAQLLDEIRKALGAKPTSTENVKT